MITVGETPGNDIAITVTGLKPNHFYNIRVVAMGPNNFQAASQTVRLLCFQGQGPQVRYQACSQLLLLLLHLLLPLYPSMLAIIDFIFVLAMANLFSVAVPCNRSGREECCNWGNFQRASRREEKRENSKLLEVMDLSITDCSAPLSRQNMSLSSSNYSQCIPSNGMLLHPVLST